MNDPRGFIVSLFAVSSLFLCITGPAFAQKTVCTSEDPTTQWHVDRLLESPERAEARQAIGLGTVDPASARLLEMPEDAPTCARLRKEIPQHYRVEGRKAPWTATYYEVGDRYVVVLEKRIEEDPDTVEIVPPLTLVFNLEYETLGRVIN